MTDMVTAALEYARAYNWAVFPLAERNKIPVVAGGFTVATTDEEQIRQAWEVRPNMNIGVATGGMSGGLVVIDLDVDSDKGEDGLETLHDWESAHGELPETVTAITGRGGLHMLYMVDAPVSSSTNGEAGVDIRGDGGYFVVPPSLHPNGRAYAWENDPSEYAVAKADANVMAFIESVQVHRRGEKFMLPDVIKGGGRNDTLMRFASSLQSKGWDDDLILASLSAVNKIKCKPPLSDAEVQKIVVSVTERYEKGNASPQETSKRVALMLKSNGAPQQTIENCCRALTGDPVLQGHFYYDVRAYTRMVSLPLPWDNSAGERAISDADYCGLAAYLEREHGLYSKQKAIDAVITVCSQNRRNTVAEWLDSLVWDGQERINWLLPMYLGCDPSDYNASVMRLLMLGAVARAYRPGTKFDYMPVLIGRQGIGKSMFVRRLCGRDTWYCDNFNTLDGDNAAEKLRGLWIAEMAELLATKRARDIESIKAFLTQMTDTIRPKYARETEQRPRACVFVGTTNDAAFLVDMTGNRRFLPIECGKHEPVASLFDDGVAEYFTQAWAEAVHIYKSEKPTLILDDRAAAYAIAAQEKYTEDDPRVGIIQAYLDNRIAIEGQKLVPNYANVRVCVQELIEHALPEAFQRQQGPALVNTLHKIMRNKIDGWESYPKSGGKALCEGYGVQRCYVSVEAARSLDL